MTSSKIWAKQSTKNFSRVSAELSRSSWAMKMPPWFSATERSELSLPPAPMPMAQSWIRPRSPSTSSMSGATFWRPSESTMMAWWGLVPVSSSMSMAFWMPSPMEVAPQASMAAMAAS